MNVTVNPFSLHGGSPPPNASKPGKEGTANITGTVYEEKPNRIPGDLLARTIAARPPNEDRLRGIVA